MKGIIIEGVATAGKTTILKHIQQKLVESKFSSTKLFISEHYTQRMLEHLLESGNITGKSVNKHIKAIIKNLETFENMLNASKFASDHRGAESFVTLERFILTYLATTPSLLDDYNIATIKRHFLRLKKLNIKQYIITLSEEQIKKNVESTLRYRNEIWKEHIKQKGGIGSVVSEYINWQQDLLNFAKLVNKSIDIEIVNVDDRNYEYYAQQIYESNFI